MSPTETARPRLLNVSRDHVPLKTSASTKCTDYPPPTLEEVTHPRNNKDKEVEATVKEQVHLRKLPRGLTNNAMREQDELDA